MNDSANGIKKVRITITLDQDVDEGLGLVAGAAGETVSGFVNDFFKDILPYFDFVIGVARTNMEEARRVKAETVAALLKVTERHTPGQ